MSRATLYFILLAACVSMRPVSAFQVPSAESRAVDRGMIKQFVNASDDERRTMIAAHPEILQKPFLEALSADGNTMRGRAEMDEAIRLYSSVLWIGREYKLPRSESTGLNNLGIIAGSRSDIPKARAYFEEAAAIAVAMKDADGTVAPLINLAILQRKVGDLDGAFASQLHALDLARQIGSTPTIARALNNIGLVLQNQGNAARALEYYVESISLKELDKTDPVSMVNTLTNIGNIYSEQGDYALALEYYQRALTQIKNSDDGESSVAGTSVYNNMGRVYEGIGEFGLAHQNLEKSLAMAEKIGDPSRVTTTLYNLGILARAEGRMDEAEKIQRRALGIREQTGEILGYIESLTELANLLDRVGRYAEALPYAERAVSLSQETRLLNQEWRAEVVIGQIQVRLGRIEEARRSYERAIATVETLRQLSAGGERGRQQILSERMGPYYGLAGLDATAGRSFEALAVVDRARARALVDILSSGRQPVQALTEEQRNGERDVTQAMLAAFSQVEAETHKPRPNAQRLSVLDANLEKARLNRDAFLSELYAKQPDLQLARGDTPEITRDRLTAILQPGTAVVMFVLDSKTAWAYVITRGPDGPRVATQQLAMDTPLVTDLAAQFAKQISTRDLAFAPNARKLYDTLFGKADALLAGVTHLILVPDGPLWQVPFQALQTPRGKFLIEERALSYSPSITALAALEQRMQSRAQQPQYLVALGDPAGAESTAPNQTGGAILRAGSGRLPEAAREVRSLGDLYGPTRSSVLVATAATETALRARASQASVLHVATHGVLDNSNPMYSHLLLAPGANAATGGAADHASDGRLEAWEVQELGLRADLVVLSACQTARGRNAWGEGIIGMSWSLFAAGASTAVVSQWEVDSASTTSLMIAFHRSRMRPGATGGSPEALRQAALSVMKNSAYRHPFYWAGFVAVGAR